MNLSVNNINISNNKNTTFDGLYVIKGNETQFEYFKKILQGYCRSKNLSYKTEIISGYCGEIQPRAKMAVATGKDAEVLGKWNEKYVNSVSRLDNEQVGKPLYDRYISCRNDVNKFNIKSFELSFINLLEYVNNRSNKFYKQIKEFTKANIPEYDFDNIWNGLVCDVFDVVTGTFKK